MPASSSTKMVTSKTAKKSSKAAASAPKVAEKATTSTSAPRRRNPKRNASVAKTAAPKKPKSQSKGKNAKKTNLSESSDLVAVEEKEEEAEVDELNEPDLPDALLESFEFSILGGQMYNSKCAKTVISANLQRLGLQNIRPDDIKPADRWHLPMYSKVPSFRLNFTASAGTARQLLSKCQDQNALEIDKNQNQTEFGSDWDRYLLITLAVGFCNQKTSEFTFLKACAKHLENKFPQLNVFISTSNIFTQLVDDKNKLELGIGELCRMYPEEARMAFKHDMTMYGKMNIKFAGAGCGVSRKFWD